MIKFSHSIFALPFAGIAILEGVKDTDLLNQPLSNNLALIIKILLCMVFLRSAAMGFNRIADRKFDALNPRTSNREVATGLISLTDAWVFFIIFLLLFFVTAFLINTMTGILSPLVAFFVLIYSYTKRFTILCHFFLGLAIGLAPAGAWIAIRGTIDSVLPLIWSGGLMFYISGFDILYSCQDIEFDKKENLFSIPSRLGVGPALAIAKIAHILSLASFIYAGIYSSSGLIFYISLILVAILFIAEHTMVTKEDFSKIPVAFFNVNASISTILFIGLLTDTLYHIRI